MRLESIRIRGLGPFRGEASLDLRELPGPLVAVTGQNGAGKSTLLELFAGAMHRECPTRGTLASLATGRDSMVEATVENGSRWTIRQLIDATSGKGEGVVMDGAGHPVTTSGKVRELDAWVGSHLPPPSVLFSTIFAPQGAGGFLAMKPAERKAVLLRVLGIEHLEQLAARARERQREASEAARILEARLADERTHGGHLEEFERGLAQLRSSQAQADAELEQHRAELEEARAALAQETAHWESLRAKVARMEALRRDVSDVGGRLAYAQQQREKAERIASEAVPIAKLEAAVSAARKTLEAAKATRATEVAGFEAAQGAVRKHGELTVERKGLEMRAANNRQLLANADAVMEAVSRLAELDGEIAEATRAAEGAEGRLREIQDERLMGVEGRIEGLRDGLARIAGCEANPDRIAMDSLAIDDAIVFAAREYPERLRTAKLAATARRHRIAELQTAKAAAAKTAATAGALEAAEARLAELGEALSRIDAQLEELGEVRPPLRPRDEPVAKAQADLAQAEATLTHGRGLLHLAESEQAACSAKIAELEPQLAKLRQELEESLGVVEVTTPPDDLTVRTTAAVVATAERLARETASAVARTEQALEVARASALRSAALELELSAAHQSLADWTRLAADLGRDGLQAMEIDAAGPELTAITNALLHECHGPRWTVSIETQKLSADGKKLLEGCEVRVIDSERGRDAAAETLSGGERVLVAEAVSLALMTVACRRQGVTRPTLVRDESGAALDAGNARVYIRMLRMAAASVGADKVLLVSHSPEVQGLCDSEVRIADGKIEVQS